ncbi:Uncharacterised protein [Mycobacterium tuberculosis]|uniref:Uncharacterized protein n=1 Tax=Mycobacterium tuberculosis TaxID=1773 RepID=A0A0U0R8E2_MYCTX|nr:Uncharacterised protein [Mycobacterium tuberculosis]
MTRNMSAKDSAADFARSWRYRATESMPWSRKNASRNRTADSSSASIRDASCGCALPATAPTCGSSSTWASAPPPKSKQ